MKVFYLVGSILFTALILVLSFENIAAQCSGMYFFFYAIRSNPTIVTLGIAVIGICTGIFYHAFLSRILNTEDEEGTDEF